MGKAGAISDEGFIAEARAKTKQQEREEVYAAVQYAASFHCSAKRKVDVRGPEKRGNETSNGMVCRYRCMRCGKSSKHMKMPGKCAGPNFLSICFAFFENGESVVLEVMIRFEEWKDRK